MSEERSNEILYYNKYYSTMNLYKLVLNHLNPIYQVHVEFLILFVRETEHVEFLILFVQETEQEHISPTFG